MNLDAYFARIGYAGPTTATRGVLDALMLAHVKAIPFENLDVLLGRGISLDDAAVDQKLITGQRGGYCFEQNGLFLRVLRALGFDATPLSARVRLGRPRDFTPARTHMFLRVELDGHPRIADVGVGGLSPTASFRLDTDEEQPTPHEPRRVIREGGRFFHQAKLFKDGVGEWVDVCEFTGEEMPPIDREVANWFTSAHPQSHFRNRLLAARALDDGGRATLLNDELTLRTRAGVSTTKVEGEALLHALERHFSLRFPEGTRFTLAPS